jgi:hypothetical protein
MQCPRCQQDNAIHARFCLGCGARLALVYGACGADLPQETRFCLRCGQALAGRPAAPARATAREAHTPRHLAEKILTSKTALEGERKEVTVRPGNPGRSTVLDKRAAPRLNGVTFAPFDSVRQCLATPRRLADE